MTKAEYKFLQFGEKLLKACRRWDSHNVHGKVHSSRIRRYFSWTSVLVLGETTNFVCENILFSVFCWTDLVSSKFGHDFNFCKRNRLKWKHARTCCFVLQTLFKASVLQTGLNQYKSWFNQNPRPPSLNLWTVQLRFLLNSRFCSRLSFWCLGGDFPAKLSWNIKQRELPTSFASVISFYKSH